MKKESNESMYMCYGQELYVFLDGLSVQYKCCGNKSFNDSSIACLVRVLYRESRNDTKKQFKILFIINFKSISFKFISNVNSLNGHDDSFEC